MATEIVATGVVPTEVEGGLDAPIVYFENVPVYGVGGGIGRVTLDCMILDSDTEGVRRQRRRAVVHLRASTAAFAVLRDAINSMEAMVAKPASSKRN